MAYLQSSSSFSISQKLSFLSLFKSDKKFLENEVSYISHQIYDHPLIKYGFNLSSVQKDQKNI